MSKPNIYSINPLDFTKVIPTRNQKVSEAPAKKLPELKSYKANEIAMALHPKAQHLIVAEVIKNTDDTYTYVLNADKEAGTEKLAYFSAGQYLSITLKIKDAILTRPYSLSSSPKEALEGKYMLTIRRTEGGLASNYILDNWEKGTKVLASAPVGNFTYEPLRDAKTVIGLAGGSGITPFFSLAKAIADGDEDAELILLYGSKSKEDALFTKEFKALEKATDKFKLVNVFSEKESKGCEKGFITADLIKKYAPDGEYSVFICGPKAMYTFVDSELPKLNIRRKFIRHEMFGEIHSPAGEADFKGDINGVYELTVHICDEVKKIECRADETILVSLEKAGIATPARCRSGECGWCHSRLISGDVYIPQSVDSRRLADIQYGYIHPCCTFPAGNIELDVPPYKAEF